MIWVEDAGDRGSGYDMNLKCPFRRKSESLDGIAQALEGMAEPRSLT